MTYMDEYGRIVSKGKDVDDFYAYNGSEEYEEEFEDKGAEADYFYEREMDRRAERLWKDR